MQRLTTRGIRTAQAIANREEFNTSGSLKARKVDGMSAWDSGRLSGKDLGIFREDMTYIRYVVWSYATPIAWWTGTVRGWYRVEQKFSPTTTKHQGNLYLIPRDPGCDGLPLAQTKCSDRAAHM